MKWKLTVNAEVHEVTAEKEMPLLWVLRDLIGVKGTKFGCGMGLCGACTVHLDGNATRACQTPISSVGTKKITTIEGISSEHAIKTAWRKHNVPQCGYCQPGQIMSATALVSRNSKPSEKEISTAMSGNLCRCGTYARIKAAILDATKQRWDA
ncbi:MAG: (2Fe-2S)-binding protein [Bdellovibrionota bacterium]